MRESIVQAQKFQICPLCGVARQLLEFEAAHCGWCDKLVGERHWRG